MTMRERHVDGYVERGATRETSVVVRRTGGFWRPWSVVGGLHELGADEVDVAEVWVYPNGQICSTVITMEDDVAVVEVQPIVS